MSVCVRLVLSPIVVSILFCASAQAQAEKLSHFVDQLGDKKKAVRLEALRQLGKLGTAAKSAAPDIGRLLRDSDDADLVAQAAASLAQIGPAGVPELVRVLKDGRNQHVRQAAAALARMGPAAKAAVPELIALLKDPDAAVRTSAAIALGEAGVTTEETTLALFDLVQDPALEARQQAGLSILRAGPKAVPGLLRIFRGDKTPLRVEAAGLLNRLGSDAIEALSDLRAGLDDGEPEVRAASALALGGIGPQAKETLPRLLQGLAEEKDARVQESCFQAAMQIGSKDVPGFLGDLKKINKEGQWVAPFVLAQFGPRAADAVMPLIKMLGDKDQTMRIGAVLALGQIGHEAKEAIPAVTMMLKDANPTMRAAAAQTLFRIDPRQEALAVKQYQAALEQLDGKLAMIEKKLSKVPIPKLDLKLRPVDRRAFLDPAFQEPFQQIVHGHLMTSVAKLKPGKLGDVNLTAAIMQFPPEAIPTVVDGVNRAGYLGLGFC